MPNGTHFSQTSTVLSWYMIILSSISRYRLSLVSSKVIISSKASEYSRETSICFACSLSLFRELESSCESFASCSSYHLVCSCKSALVIHPSNIKSIALRFLSFKFSIFSVVLLTSNFLSVTLLIDLSSCRISFFNSFSLVCNWQMQ